MRTWKVGIVGGGPGGLMTAYALQKLADCPVQITLFEASDRLGGKILTPQFKEANVGYEAGAAEFYDYSVIEEDPLKELISELGLPMSPMGGSAVIMNQKILSNLDDIRDELGPQTHAALLAFDQRARDKMTPQEFYHSDHPDGAQVEPDPLRFDSFLAGIDKPVARDFIENLIHSDLATEPQKTSIAYGLQNYLMNDPAYMILYGIDGGNERLPQELAARIHATIRMQQPVSSVGQHDEKIRISSSQNGESRHDDFDFVVIALPHNQVPSVSFDGELLAGAVKQHQAYYHYPAHYLRMTILFDKPFWRESLSDSYWMLDHFGGCCLYDESSRDPGCEHGVLGWLLGGDAAEEMSQMNDEQLIQQALDSLPDFLAHGRECFVEGHVHRWIAAVNAMPGGHKPPSLDQRHQPEPSEHQNLFVVGDYLFDSTLNGVLDSANYVSAWIAAQMTDNSKR